MPRITDDEYVLYSLRFNAYLRFAEGGITGVPAKAHRFGSADEARRHARKLDPAGHNRWGVRYRTANRFDNPKV